MNVVITGGAGFIGSHLADALVGVGAKVLVLDNLKGGTRANVPAVAGFEQVDLVDGDLDSLLARFRPDVIVHCAAQASVASSMNRPLENYQATQLASFRVAQAASRQGVRHLILLSTAGVYGAAERPATESDLPAPANYYGVHKWAAERYFELSGVPSTALRLGNVYGPRQRFDAEGGAVAIFLTRILRGEPIVLYGAGEQTRDYIYVADVVESIMVALRHRLTGVWNVASGQETPMRTILAALVAATGRPANVQVEPRQPGDVARSSLDASRLIATGLWQPVVSLDEGMRRTVLAYTSAASR
ncbi:MAG TPA: NAD-dependent epimerase/dehydratase family protein [Chloroflexota bacterium]|nr:NAD-dependent epimerase/dehydratase family protein [Chloroflexota bacterium]